MITIDMTRTPATGLSSFVATAHSAHTAPVWTEQGTGLPFVGTAVPAVLPASVAFGARSTDLPGRRPRGAPV